MEVVKNANGKTVCYADAKEKTVEIVHKGFKTIIRFLSDDIYEIENSIQAR